MSASRSQALAVMFDAAEDCDDYDDALRERVAASLHRLRIATAWRFGVRVDAASGMWLAGVGRTRPGWDDAEWRGRVELPDDLSVERRSEVYATEAEAKAWCDEQLRADGWTPVPEAP